MTEQEHEHKLALFPELFEAFERLMLFVKSLDLENGTTGDTILVHAQKVWRKAKENEHKLALFPELFDVLVAMNFWMGMASHVGDCASMFQGECDCGLEMRQRQIVSLLQKAREYHD